MRQNLYSILLIILAWSLTGTSYAQYTWKHLGPDNVNGITRALVFDNAANIYAGSQGGGLYRSQNLGDTWERITSYDDSFCNPNITSIAVDGSNIYVGTGATQFSDPYVERRLGYILGWDYRAVKFGFTGYLDGLPGGGVYVSTDNGSSWKVVNATNSDPAGTPAYQGPFTDIQKLAVSNGRVFIASHEGLYFSDNQLESVQLANGPAFLQQNVIYDVEVAANNTIFVVAHGINGTETLDSLYISTDNGSNFTAVTDEAIIANGRVGFVRTEVAVSPSDPNTVYLAGTQASGEVGRIFRYDVSGGNWTQVGISGPTFAPLGINGRDAFALAVYPDNPNEIIIAGDNWYSLSEAEGWQLIGQGFQPALSTFREPPIHTIAFHPTDPNILAVGAERDIFISRDRGNTFASRKRGMGTHPFVTASAVKVTNTEDGETTEYDAVFGVGTTGGYVNHLFNTELPSNKSFGRITGVPYSDLQFSTVFPGGVIAQGTDGGVVRSLDYGLTFEQFYNIPVNPQVRNLVPAGSDTIINQSNANSEAGNLLDAPTPAKAVFAIDENIPEDLLDRTLTEEEFQNAAESYLFFCSQKYVWICQGAFGDGLQVRWNRITSELVDGLDEVFTAMAVAPDGSHTLYVASSLGNIWRIDNANDLENFDADVNVVQMNASLSQSGLTLIGNSISSLAIDPQNPDRLVITYAGYGAVSQGVTTWLWITDDATADVPVFGEVRGLAPASNQPIYTSEFVIDGNSGESVLLLGREKGLLSVRSITDQGFPIIPKIYLPDENGMVEEIGDLSNIQVSDIFTRKYAITTDGDNVSVSKDYTTFVATYGRGMYSSADFSPARKGGERPEAEVPVSLLESFVYPNPSEGVATLEIRLPEVSEVEIRVIDLSGKVYSNELLNEVNGVVKHPLPAEGMAPGMYLIEVMVNNESQSSITTHKWVQL
ncbi:MAG: T9SS type A sorting domain-containing protein [Bacteroidota bacterium]